MHNSPICINDHGAYKSVNDRTMPKNKMASDDENNPNKNVVAVSERPAAR